MSQNTITPTWTLADKLRKARETTGLDQEQFAAAVGVSRNTVNNYEKGRTQPRLLELRAWASASGVDLGWLEADWVGRARRDSNPRPSDYIAAPWAPRGLRLTQTDAPGRATRRRQPRRRVDTYPIRDTPSRRHLEAA